MTGPSGRSQQPDGLFGTGIPLGRYAGVHVSAHWSVLIILVLLTELLGVEVLPSAAPRHATAVYVATALIVSAIFLAALLAHELAHAVVARHYGMPVKRITLWMLGGMTELGGEPPSPRADAIIAAAGPATSLLIGGVFAVLAWLIGTSGLIGAATMWLAGVSLLLGVFNLLPGAPLDGGRVLRAVLWGRYRDRARATDASARVGRGIGFFFAALGVLEFLGGAVAGLWLALIGWFMLNGAAGERYLALMERVRGLSVHDVMTAPPTLALSWQTLSDFVANLTPEQAAQQVFPVVGFEGEPEGVLTAWDLHRVPATERATTRVREISRRRIHPLTVTPDTSLADIAAPIHMHGGLAVVVEDRRVIGTVTEADLHRAASLASLGWHKQPSDRSTTT